ncbi:hypothetical protein F4821DRAFT_188934 [Hypoxylon rubiginosum]|uniref:Uncharacterized protein n=1 Tax=Hypoxylon rubiginosum TaxID=110542 RepID=A0ACC0DGI7_9PEZI|nr:hypothetical protein F4821DRAFT_188934 [Hypoxylon rubiginosum]
MSSAAAAPATEARPLSFMETIDPLVSFYRPPEASSLGASIGADHQPQLIIIASWTDARDAHIAKYVVKYQALYPASQILLLKSTTNHIIRPSLIGPSMKHAASVVRAAFQAPTSSSSSPRLLIHMFSNGGSSSIANLYEQYAATADPNDEKHLPPHVTVFDSCPGVFSIPHTVAFFNVGLSSFQRLIAAPIIYAWAAVYSVLIASGFLPDSLSDWGKTHNDTGNKNEVRRVYIYSPSDALIDYKAVEAHAAEAKSKGFSVVLERYEGSAHVAHLRKDESRYWEIVRRIMED